jgi:hypothetical protein
MVGVEKYDPSRQADWNAFVRESKTPLFFLEREFLEYHADRFEDESLVVSNDQGIIALLPATRHREELISHGGLTYGGLLTRRRARAPITRMALKGIVAYMRDRQLQRLRYKAIPHIFHQHPAEEDLYFLLNDFSARLVRRDLSSVIPLAEPLKYSKGRKALLSKAKKAGVEITRSTDWETFHNMLSTVLAVHGAKPVHSVGELQKLAHLFPHSVKLFSASLDGQMLAATVLFDFGQVVHTQYLATSELGKQVGALDFLIDEMIQRAKPSSTCFSFGISTEDNGKVLNEGLLSQKEGFGGRSICIDTYEIDAT